MGSSTSRNRNERHPSGYRLPGSEGRWVPAASYNNAAFACPDPANSLYTETINGTCYALAAIHISSKVMPNWLWATFEPNSNVTNPNRCDSTLYGTCFDPWGTTSSRPYGKGETARQSPELHEAMAASGLNPAFNNYFLTGVQTEFVDNYGKPIQLGNSFIEFQPGSAAGQIVMHHLPPVRVFRRQAARARRAGKQFRKTAARLAEHRLCVQPEPKRKLHAGNPQLHDAGFFLDAWV